MMRILQVMLLSAGAMSAHSVLANEPPGGTPSPLGELQAQLDALAARTLVLEQDAPTANVDGRTYCFVLNLTLLRGLSFNGTEEVETAVIRRSVTFDNGNMDGAFVSSFFNNLLDTSIVETGPGTATGPIHATYSQTGSKLDIAFDNGITANWYVSKDGSAIHGTSLRHGAFGPNGVVTIGFLRNWTLVETDAAEICDAEYQ